MKLLIFIFFMLLSYCQIFAANDNIEEVQDLIEKAKEALYTNPKQSIYFTSKAIESLPENGKNNRKAEAILINSRAQKLLGDFDTSIKNLYDALDLVTPENNKLKAQIYSLMGIIYCNLYDYKKAIELNDQAMSIFKSIGDSVSIATCFNDRGIMHCYINEFNIAEKFFLRSLAINRKKKQIKNIAANLNNLCLYKGNTQEKLRYINEAIIINKNLNQKWSLGENYNNMGLQYFYAGEYDKALLALDKATQISKTIGAQELICDNYEYRSWIYAAMKKYDKAYEYANRVFNISKDIQSGKKLRNIENEISQKRYLDQQRNSELKEQAYKIDILNRNFLILLTSFIFLIIVCLLFSKWYKRKRNMELMEAKYKLEQSERELAELKIHQQEVELHNVQTDLERSSQEVTNFAVFLNSRNELLDKIREMIKKGYKMKEGELIAHLKKINSFITQYQNGDRVNNQLILSIEEKNHNFIESLTKIHPSLTQGEKYLAALLRVNLSTKEIALITGTSPKTINMNRYRLRKSLSLNSEEDLVNYLQNIKICR